MVVNNAILIVHQTLNTLRDAPETPLKETIRDAVFSRVRPSARRIICLCTKRGLLDDTAADPLTDEKPVLAALTAASVRGITATGARAGQRLRRVLKDPATGVRTAPLCFASRGFSLHAATRIAGPDPSDLDPDLSGGGRAAGDAPRGPRLSRCSSSPPDLLRDSLPAP